MRLGAATYAQYGTEKSKGTRVYCLSGHVERPGNYELPLGTPLRTLIEDFGGGVWHGKKLKAIIPGGSSTPLSEAGADRHAAGLRVHCWRLARCSAPAGVVVLDEDTCIVGAVLRMTEFYRDESCGKCTPCREGTYWLVQLLERLEEGHGKESDIDLLTISVTISRVSRSVLWVTPRPSASSAASGCCATNTSITSARMAVSSARVRVLASVVATRWCALTSCAAGSLRLRAWVVVG